MQAIPLMEFESPECCTASVFCHSGTAVVAGYADGSLRLFDLDTVSIQWSATLHAAPIVGLAMDRNGGAILAASRDGTLTVSSAKAGELQLHTRDLLDVLKGFPLDAIALSRMDGTLMAAAWSHGFAVLASPWRTNPLRAIAQYEAPLPTADVLVCPVAIFLHFPCTACITVASAL
jgi:hypothetical protein